MKSQQRGRRKAETRKRLLERRRPFYTVRVDVFIIIIIIFKFMFKCKSGYLLSANDSSILTLYGEDLGLGLGVSVTMDDACTGSLVQSVH